MLRDLPQKFEHSTDGKRLKRQTHMYPKIEQINLFAVEVIF